MRILTLSLECLAYRYLTTVFFKLIDFSRPVLSVIERMATINDFQQASKHDYVGYIMKNM